MKTIIMQQLWPCDNKPGTVNNYRDFDEAETLCKGLGGRLPTEGEVGELDRLLGSTAVFFLRPYGYVEWVSGSSSSVPGWPSHYRYRTSPFGRDNTGFRCVKIIDDDMPVPKGWVVLSLGDVGAGWRQLSEFERTETGDEYRTGCTGWTPVYSCRFAEKGPRVQYRRRVK